MSSSSPLPPGFRFHPTDEELILHYLRNQAAALPCPVSIIAEVDIYKFDPWDLPAKAMFGEQEWYFFSPRDRKYPNGVRPNRAAASGYWKATGTDKPIVAAGGGTGNIGVKKALVFYRGRPPTGRKTNWIMHEYRLAEAHAGFNCKPTRFKNASMRLDDWVLCRIYKRNDKLERELPLPDQEQLSSPIVQKTHPVSDFSDDYSALSHLFDDLPELQKGSQAESFVPQSGVNQLMADDNNFCRNENTHLLQLNHQEQFPAPIVANPSQVFAELCSQVNGAQRNSLNQYFINQKMLLNSQGLQ